MKKLALLPILLATAACGDGYGDRHDRGDYKTMKMERMNKVADYYFDQIDLNDDGKITRGEHDAFGRKMFREADTNRDGVLTRDELKAAQAREYDKMKSRRHMAKYDSGSSWMDDDQTGDGNNWNGSRSVYPSDRR